MRNGLKAALFLSAFSPILISMSFVKYLDSGFNYDILFLSVIGVLGSLVTFFIIFMLKKHGETIAFTAKKIESNDALLLGVFASYFAPFISKASEITVNTTILILFISYIMLWFMSSIPPHPILRALSFRFYKVESANGVVYTLISQRELLDPKQVRQVKRISSSMLMEVS